MVQELRSSGETLARETKQQCPLDATTLEFGGFWGMGVLCFVVSYMLFKNTCCFTYVIGFYYVF